MCFCSSMIWDLRILSQGNMEKAFAGVECVVNDALLRYVLEVYCIPHAPWKAVERRCVDHAAKLHLLQRLATACKKTRREFAITL